MSNPNVAMTLHQAVQQVLHDLIGLDVEYEPGEPRYNAVVRMLNRALRANALEHEWSYYSDILDLGAVVSGQNSFTLANTVRVRQTNDDAVRIRHEGYTVGWAYFLPRDALHKYAHRAGLWASYTNGQLDFSRPFTEAEADYGYEVAVPIMREPVPFVLPELGVDPDTHSTTLAELDFSNPDVIIGRAAYYYAQTDPVMQPRVQTLEGDYKDLMYQLIERDVAHTDSPYQNDFFVPVMGSLNDSVVGHGLHPHADDRRTW